MNLPYFFISDLLFQEPSETEPPPPPPSNQEEKKKAAVAFISQKLNANDDFQKFSKRESVGLDVSKDIQDKAKVHNFDKETFEEGENEFMNEFTNLWSIEII